MILKQYLDTVKAEYDYILIDCMPSLGMITINALVASELCVDPGESSISSGKKDIQTVDLKRLGEYTEN